MRSVFGVMSEAWSAGLLHGHPGAGGGRDGPRGAGVHANHGYNHSYKYTLYSCPVRPRPGKKGLNMDFFGAQDTTLGYRNASEGHLW
jgi:hypothetical protein